MGSEALDRRLTHLFGASSAKSLERAFGHRTVGDLLEHYPRRYAHRGELTPLAGLREGEEVTIVARVAHTSSRRMMGRKGTILDVVISDGSGRVSLAFFNQAWRESQLTTGRIGMFSGRVGSYRGGLQLAHPDYELFDEEVDTGVAESWARLPIPVYPATSALPSWRVAAAIATALDSLGPDPLGDPVPARIVARDGLFDWREALELIHRPKIDSDWMRARDTLRYQEALVLQTALVQRRDALRATQTVPRPAGHLLAEFDAGLAWQLTASQAAAGVTISEELAQPRPMNRLLQGEVGSGKTLVAIRAILQVAESGGQSALLAPTEVLAQQHLRSIVRVLGPDLAAKLHPVLLTGSLGTVERKRALLAAASGQSSIVIGTHALLGDRVQFADLGLVVVDEQHRFGVEQRDVLREKGTVPPHLLVLTATPIPRTVAMTVFGDLDVTTIAELPAGRAPIASHLVPLAEKPGWEPRIWSRLSEELAAGRQAFVVCPTIDDSGASDEEDDLAIGEQAAPRDHGVASVTATLDLVKEMPALAEYQIRALHGRMSSEEKDAVMSAFASGAVDVLVCTTVVEVGVDVPNASMMVVLDADRFGVSQLHQLRGRVGRGSVPGIALFVTNATEGSLALQRVSAVAETTDGFALAERDLQLRHEGDVLGSAQSGRRSGLRLLSAATDGDLIATAREDAISIVAADPDLKSHPALASAIARRLDREAEAFLTRS